MRPRSASVWLSALCASIGGATARPCSVDSSYRAPTHFERVKDSEVIVLANAVGFVPSAGSSRWGRFRFELLDLLERNWISREAAISEDEDRRARAARAESRKRRWAAVAVCVSVLAVTSGGIVLLWRRRT